MARFLTTFLILLCSASASMAQNGNEWIVPAQPYVKIPVGKDGLYRITPSALINAGFPPSVDPKKIQLFHRGIEQSIIVAGEDDHALNSTDYIEFIGKKNDGELDRSLYIDPLYQPHTRYSLFNDTTFYFLTAGANDGQRMQRLQESVGTLTPSPYIFRERSLLFTTQYSRGRDYGYAFHAMFDEGEGWMGPLITESSGLKTEKLTGITSPYTAGPKPTVEIVFTGRGAMDHQVIIYVGASSRELTSVTVKGFETQRLRYELEWSDISNGELPVGFKVNVAGQTAARISLNYISLRYASEPNVAGESGGALAVPSDAGEKTYLSLTNASGAARFFDITASARELLATMVSTTANLVVPDASAQRNIFMTTASEVAVVKRVVFDAIDPMSHNYLIITHGILRKPAGGVSDPVQAYASYRASAEGGALQPAILDINRLYDQFSFGEKSPVAIFNLMRFYSQRRLPDYLFLIGKGLDVDYDHFRKPTAFPGVRSLIPSAGLPASDAAFTAGLTGDAYVPAVPTGRLSASSPQDVIQYLNKVIEAEQRPFNDLRRKHVLHLSGGISTGEPVLFKSILQSFARTAEFGLLGGRVTAIAKQSTEITTINIAKEVNAGVGLVTFFGHSSPGNLDFDIGYATDDEMGYRNKGKYPVLLMNGCDAGSFFLHHRLFGEDWVNAADRGALAFIAHASFGYVDQLRTYSGLFYQVGFTEADFISKGLGDIQKETIRRYLMLRGRNNVLDLVQVQQMVLVGDPAAKLFGATAADFAVSDESMSLTSFDDDPVTVASDSFAINFIVKNYGQANQVPLKVRLVRTFEDRSTISYDSVYAPVAYADTLQFVVRGDDRLHGGGKNTFEIRIDPDSETPEISETNNSAWLDYTIPENGTQNLFPQNFSIVTSNAITLAFQHTSLSTAPRDFLLEVDTVKGFNSAFKKAFTISAALLARQDLSLLTKDSTVYYWRTKLKTPGERESHEWASSSFTFIQGGSEGWAQLAYDQISDNRLIGLVSDPEIKALTFEQTQIPISVRTYGALAGKPVDSVSVRVDGLELLISNFYVCRTNTVNLVAFSRISAIPYPAIPFQWFNGGGRVCGRQPWVINSFQPTELVTGNDDDIIEYIDNVAAGDSVLIFNIGDAGFPTWPAAAKSKLAEVGISTAQLNVLVAGEAVVFFGRKGLAAGQATMIRLNTNATTGSLVAEGSVSGVSAEGEMRSALIGPSRGWKQLKLRTSNVQVPDSIAVTVVGVEEDGGEKILFENLRSNQDLQSVDASVYPYIKLNFKTSDKTNVSAAQLRHWLVTYDQAPEGLVFYRGTAETKRLQEGEQWSADYGFVNITNKAFDDEVTVSVNVINDTQVKTFRQSMKIDGPAALDTTLFTVAVDTRAKVGLNSVEVVVNERGKEVLHANNRTLQLDQIDVFNESFAPLIDITVDGRHIEKEEIVKPAPEITVLMWDENPFLLKQDTLGLEMKIGSCKSDDCEMTRIHFSQPEVTWSGATPDTGFKLHYRPANLSSGTYKFEFAGVDGSGNPGVTQSILFTVSNELGVTISGAYPNPASGEFRFGITSSGEAPQGIRLTLQSTNGGVVRDVLLNAHNLSVGNNFIKFQTRDESGQLLPAGIYIYKLTVVQHDKAVTSVGKLFVKY